MSKKKNLKNPHMPSQFLVRIHDSELLNQLYEVINADKEKKSRNSIINECLKNWLPVMLENKNPATSLKSIIEKEMEDFKRYLKRDTNTIQTYQLILHSTQLAAEKGIGYLISQLEHILKNQAAIPTLPDIEIELGNYDMLPKRISEERDRTINELIKD